MTAFDKERLIHFSQEIFAECNKSAPQDKDLEKNFQHYIQTLTIYHTLLEDTRAQYNLIGPNENIVSHIIDSLSALPIFIEILQTRHSSYPHSPPCFHIADLGTGAGFPSIPLIIAFSYLSIVSPALLPMPYPIPYHWHLLERSHKKTTFLAQVIEKIHPLLHKTPMDKTSVDETSINTTSIIHIVEKNLCEWKPKNSFDIICSRAFHPIVDTLADMKKISGNAALLFYKGKRQSIDDELGTMESLSIPTSHSQHPSKKLTVKHIHQLFHEPDKERHIVHIQFSE